MTGAAMLELVALVTAAVLTPAIVVLGLFRLAGLKRVEDLQPSPEPEVDEWAASHEQPFENVGHRTDWSRTQVLDLLEWQKVRRPRFYAMQKKQTCPDKRAAKK